MVSPTTLQQISRQLLTVHGEMEDRSGDEAWMLIYKGWQRRKLLELCALADATHKGLSEVEANIHRLEYGIAPVTTLTDTIVPMDPGKRKAAALTRGNGHAHPERETEG